MKRVQTAEHRKLAHEIRKGIHQGVDLKPMLDRFWRLEAMRAEGRAPSVRWKAYRHGGSWGTAWVLPREITMRISVGASLEGAVETLLHEAVHCALPVHTNHNELFCRRLVACANEAFGLSLDINVMLGLPLGRRKCLAYVIDDYIVEALKASNYVEAVLKQDATLRITPTAPVDLTAKREALIAKRRAHAEAALAKWETNLKRAKTIAARWRTKVRYYEKREATLLAAKTKGGA